jgi:hypothetical protein
MIDSKLISMSEKEDNERLQSPMYLEHSTAHSMQKKYHENCLERNFSAPSEFKVNSKDFARS